MCREPGHVSGSTECKHYAQTPETGEIVVFQGKSNPLSNFYPCDYRVFGEPYKSVEHACKLTKAIRAGNLDAAKMVKEAATALTQSRLVTRLQILRNGAREKIVMEEIVSSKAEQIPEIKIKFKRQNYPR